MTHPSLEVGFVVFPDATPLDLTGPYEALSRVPGARCRLMWKTKDPVRAERGFVLTPDVTFDEVERLDVICVPGGPGISALLEDAVVLREVRRLASTARYVTAVCTGALVLGAAGLLVGRRATTHWMSLDFLRLLGATPVADRVVIDGNLVTGGGVTAGIDFGLTLASELVGVEAAQAIQLAMEYSPKPPFDAGSPATAPAEVVQQAVAAAGARQQERLIKVKNAAALLDRP